MCVLWLCCRKRAYMKETVYSDKLQHYSAGRGKLEYMHAGMDARTDTPAQIHTRAQTDAHTQKEVASVETERERHTQTHTQTHRHKDTEKAQAQA